MDSMRNLNTSLPGGTSPPKQQNEQPPEQLLQAFKEAALSVTKLYKTAAVDQVRARAEGYQDALDELLIFLDKEDIGLSDGEGWRIRRWATERLDGRDAVSQNAESDEERDVERERGSSPVIHRAPSSGRLSTRNVSPVQQEQTPPVISTPVLGYTPSMLPPTGTFTFRSQQAYPQDTEMGLSDAELPENKHDQALESSVVSSSHTPAASITISRPNRTTSRHGSQSSRLRNPQSIGRGAGAKRKINFGEFFDIGNLGHNKEERGGGGKRGRFV